MIKINKLKYKGEFKQNSLEGKGKIIYNNGVYYFGQFKKNERNGIGEEYYENGKLLFEGEIVNGKYKGKGKYYDKED